MDKTKVYKEKQYLIFDFEDGRTVKYDFATKSAIGIKGKPVKNLCGQLSGITVDDLIDCCDDKNYAKFLKFIRDRHINNGVSNIGTILSKVPEYSIYEQLFSAGLEDVIELHNFSRSINDIQKSLIKIAKLGRVKISNVLCKYWKEDPDAHYLGYTLNYISLNDVDLSNIFKAEHTGYRNYNRYYGSYFNLLIHEYGYSAKSLFKYIDRLKTYEAIEDMFYLMRELYDYANMMKTISDKFDKYPRNFLTTHRIACRNYNRLKKEFSEEMFKKRIEKEYECSYKNYVFIYPNCTQDIKDEAVMQNNCVASYIDRVIDGECHIMFLRSKDNLNKSLVTLEIRGNKIVQAFRHFNDPITDQDQEAINFWNRKYEKECKDA